MLQVTGTHHSYKVNTKQILKHDLCEHLQNQTGSLTHDIRYTYIGRDIQQTK